MLRYTLKRLLSLIISLAVASVVIFAVIEVAPGDPASFMLGVNAQPDTVAHLPFALPFLGDGINLLPILMAVTMVLQMKMTPQTGDKMQRRIFMLMPVIFFFFCYNFASALALYWTTSNIFAIVQTMITKRLPEPELKKKTGANKKGFMQRLQERAEEAQRMQKERRASMDPNAGPPKKPKKRRPRTGG